MVAGHAGRAIDRLNNTANLSVKYFTTIRDTKP